jgi:hypothetical protein
MFLLDMTILVRGGCVLRPETFVPIRPTELWEYVVWDDCGGGARHGQERFAPCRGAARTLRGSNVPGHDWGVRIAGLHIR